MTVFEFLDAVVRRWRTVLLTVLLVFSVASVGLIFTPRTWTATATVGLVPGKQAAGLGVLGQLSTAAGLYVEVAGSAPVRQRAGQIAGATFGSVEVQTFRDAPLIIALQATAPSAAAAESSAQAYAQAFKESADAGAALQPGQIEVHTLSQATRPTAPTTPRVGPVLMAAAISGLVMGLLIGLWRDQRAASRAGSEQDGSRRIAHRKSRRSSAGRS